jgi:hypothetical protein
VLLVVILSALVLPRPDLLPLPHLLLLPSGLTEVNPYPPFRYTVECFPQIYVLFVVLSFCDDKSWTYLFLYCCYCSVTVFICVILLLFLPLRYKWSMMTSNAHWEAMFALQPCLLMIFECLHLHSEASQGLLNLFIHL